MNIFSRIIVEDVLAFAYCNEDQMDEDFAVLQLERIAHDLRSSGTESVAQFVQTVRAMEKEAREQGLEERSQQLVSMPEHLGLEC